MKLSTLIKPGSIIMIILGIILILVIWKPVLPTSFMIQGMAEMVDVKSLALKEPVVVRFELEGKGGGNYNLVVDSDKAEVTEGVPDRIDCLFKMKAADFTELMYNMASGKANESVYMTLLMSNKLDIAGDMMLFGKLLAPKEDKIEADKK